MKARRSGRRGFLKDGASLAGLALGAVWPARGQTVTPMPMPVSHPGARDTRAYGERSRFVTTGRGPLPWQLTPLQDSMGTITPSSLHYTVATKGQALYPVGGLPDIDPQQHRLLIHGLVDRPLIFTMDDLMRFPSVSRIHFLECAGGQAGSRYAAARESGLSKSPPLDWKTSCSEWTGVLLSVLLGEVGVQKGASWLIAEGADAIKHTRSIPTEKAMDDIIVAYGQNGEPVRPEQGYPLRLVVPGFEGNFNVKWLRRIKVVDQPYMTVADTVTYAVPGADGKAHWFQYEMPPHSVITTPSAGQRLRDHGFYEIRGLAWSGGGAIRRVEVSTDGGRSWKEAALQEPVHRMAHTRFCFPWNWDGEEAVLQSRCTDELGQVQPTLAELSTILGRSLDYWGKTTNDIKHFNPIHPWKVTREGSIENALVL